MGRRFVRLLPLLVLLSAVPAAAQDDRAFLEIVLNGVAKDDTLVLFRGDDALVGTAALTRAGVEGFRGSRETVDGTEFVSLASLSPDVTFTVDDRDLRLSIDGRPAPARRHRARPAAGRTGRARAPERAVRVPQLRTDGERHEQL